MTIHRRTLLKAAGAASLLGALPRDLWAAGQAAAEKADYTLRIVTALAELAPDHIVSTTLYNGQFPGPLLRLKEGQRTIIDVYNDTDTPELLHPHGLIIPIHADGAAEEGSPYIPAHGMRRISFVPQPSGLRFYHTHVVAGGDLNRGTYTGQAGPIYIEPRDNPGAYDREVFLVLKEFEPTFSQGGDMPMDVLAGEPIKDLQETGKRKEEEFKGPKGYEVGYDLFSINGKMLGQGEPIRVKEGERVLFHIVNASAGEIRSLAVPGHRFKIVALDGNPVPTHAEVPLLWLGTAERISALVEMNHPGVWVMGDLADDDRKRGMGIVIEYAGASGEPQWTSHGLSSAFLGFQGGVEQRVVFEHGAGDIEKTVADGAQCTGMGTAAGFQSNILGFALLIAPPRGVRQVVNGVPQSWIAGEPSSNGAALARSPGDGRHAAQNA